MVANKINAKTFDNANDTGYVPLLWQIFNLPHKS